MTDQAKLAAEGIPKYAKYVKDIVAKKNKLAEYETASLTKDCSSRIINKVKLPTKQKDPGSFTKLGFGNSKPTTILLQLTDRSVARPDGIIEDVLVLVGSLIFPVDFVILDFEPYPNVPFLLGWSFLAMGGALIDVAVGATHDESS
ncbi:uncharacterized protein LOC129883558 [Solanum dulcamara]|uniref:uncharacterized protein LOC129883558 n=1 Tax=Solanum dulcamara TaxID=45834 RepID=UPI002485BAA1|nr:uncharacterized protein LOC129883558 [Solanum dulcamara]